MTSIVDLEREVAEIEHAWDGMISAGQAKEAHHIFSGRFKTLNKRLADARQAGAKAVVRLRLLAGEVNRDLDRACGEALGWRVSRDEWWNWHPGPVYDPPGDAWCIRRDGANDRPCDEALPHFTAEDFEREVDAQDRAAP